MTNGTPLTRATGVLFVSDKITKWYNIINENTSDYAFPRDVSGRYER